MSEPMHTNEDIRARPDEFRAVLERAREEFLRIDGVVSVGVGQKASDGEYRDDIAIVVTVREKRPLEELPPQDRIPPVYHGYRTDVVVLRESRMLVCDNTAEYSVIQGGIQIVPAVQRGAGTYFPGTLGCIVRRRGDTGRENVYLLSCRHVLFAGGAGEGDYVYHPFAPLPEGTPNPGPTRALGPIQSTRHLENVGYRPGGSGVIRQFFLDCATARIDIDSKCFGSTCTKDVIEYDTKIIDLALGPENSIADVRSVIDEASIVGQQVYKVGKKTGRTVGIVRHVGASTLVPRDPDDPAAGTMVALELIEIDFDTASTPDNVNCLGNARFAEPGDSGALLLDDQRRAIGLVAIGPSNDSDPPPRAGAVFACHIMPILDKLGICIPTAGGTSRGSCSAVDGSGTAPAAPATAELPADGVIRFTGGVGAAPALAPMPITDAERDRLLALRDALRETAQGRALHDAFAEVRREIGYLVRNSRPVKVVWHRMRGPAFLAHVLNHLRGDTPTLPRAIDGIGRDMLLERMGEVLAAHGSRQLGAAIVRHGAELRAMLADADTANDCLAALRARQSTTVTT